MEEALIDHIDLRVRNRKAVEPFYDELMSALGLRQREQGADWITYGYPNSQATQLPFFALAEEPDHQPNQTRIAFAAGSRADVDRLAETVKRAGGRAIEGPMLCPEYTPVYYAMFFEDPDGNKLEICHRAKL